MSETIAKLDTGTLVAFAPMAFLGLVWIVAVATSLISRAPQPKTGLRRSDLAAIAISFFFAMSGVFAMTLPTVWGEPKASGPEATVATESRGTCASLQLGMKADEVKRVMGEPDEARSEEDVRGPGAQAWVYRTSRCSVHVLGGRVDFID